MKIEDNRGNAREFGKLMLGDVFSYLGNIYISSELLYDMADEPHNAVNLRNGIASHFDDNCLVELANDTTLVLN